MMAAGKRRRGKHTPHKDWARHACDKPAKVEVPTHICGGCISLAHKTSRVACKHPRAAQLLDITVPLIHTYIYVLVERA